MNSKNLKLPLMLFVIFVLTSLLIYLNILFFLKLFNSSISNAEISNSKNITNLIEKIAQQTTVINQNVLENQQTIQLGYNSYLTKHKLIEDDTKLLDLMYQQYNAFDPNNQNQWRLLNEDVQPVPVPLVIAMAIYNLKKDKKSNHNMNNMFFHVPCNNANCGMPEKLNLPDAYTAYTTYLNLQLAVADFILYVNSSPEYARWRKARFRLLQQHSSDYVMKLTDALVLTPFYTKNDVTKLKMIIQKYHLLDYDKKNVKTTNIKCDICKNLFYL